MYDDIIIYIQILNEVLKFWFHFDSGMLPLATLLLEHWRTLGACLFVFVCVCICVCVFCISGRSRVSNSRSHFSLRFWTAF